MAVPMMMLSVAMAVMVLVLMVDRGLSLQNKPRFFIRLLVVELVPF